MALPMKAPAMKGAAMKAMKAAMKAKRVSTIAKGKRAKLQVFNGSKVKTVSQITKDQLMKNKRGKIVTKKANAAGKKKYESTLKVWIECVNLARKALSIKGFCAVNGKLAQGKALYAKARALYTARQ
mmetsp:Transcript_103949/g.289649  ORF Transcript_103949/g.289649 Transcript_103949/m.289649 type:complete len:127 (+) Transcript_103949:68-448(+)